MLVSYAVGILAVVLLMVAWVAVQTAWRGAFPAAGPETDALAVRPGCAACGHAETGGCQREDDGFIREAQACRNRGTTSGARGGDSHE
jgi:hypothetical protein